MRKIWYIGLMSIGLVACGTVGKAPIDDAYYWPDKTQPAQVSQPAQVTQTARPATTSQPVQTGPSIRYTNVQDTTVTIRIKK
jgi:hypothetical protein